MVRQSISCGHQVCVKTCQESISSYAYMKQIYLLHTEILFCNQQGALGNVQTYTTTTDVPTITRYFYTSNKFLLF